MLDLANDLTLTFESLIHNFELRFVSLMFRLLPTIGTTVATGLADWREFSVSFREGTVGYTASIGKSKDDVWTLILGEWAKYQVDPLTSVPELTELFEYVTEKGVK